RGALREACADSRLAEIRLQQDVRAHGARLQMEERTGAWEVAEEPRAGARQRRRDEDEQPVDEPRLEKGGRDRGAAFQQQRLHAFGRERSQLVLEAVRPKLELQPLAQRPASEGKPPRLPLDSDAPRVETRLVGPYRAHPDGDGVARGSQLVHEPTR